ncbi:hypothetical protein AOLI_G00245680 [Acnodon oligacanthus]
MCELADVRHGSPGSPAAGVYLRFKLLSVKAAALAEPRSQTSLKPKAKDSKTGSASSSMKNPPSQNCSQWS